MMATDSKSSEKGAPQPSKTGMGTVMSDTQNTPSRPGSAAKHLEPQIFETAPESLETTIHPDEPQEASDPNARALNVDRGAEPTDPAATARTMNTRTPRSHPTPERGRQAMQPGTKPPANAAYQHQYQNQQQQPPPAPPLPPPPQHQQQQMHTGESAWYSSWRLARNREQVQEAELNNLRSEVMNQRKTIRSHQEAAMSVNQENFELREKIKELNSVIRQTQEKAFGRVSQGRWTAQPDRDVRDSLNLLQRRMRDWSKEYAIESTQALDKLKLKGPEKTQFLDNLRNVLSLTSDGNIPESLRGGNLGRRLPSILLNALLAHDVYSQVFDDPFYFLGDEETSQGDGRRKLSDALAEVYTEVIDLDDREAHIWRSQLLRIYNPPLATAKNEKERLAAKAMESRIDNCSTLLVTKFATGPVKPLLRQIPPAQEPGRLEKLKRIYIDAGQLSTRYWTQRSFLKSHHLETLHTEPFKAGSQLMEAHPSQGLEDDEDNSHDGRRIAVVVHPAVLAFGNDDCEDFQHPRVWAKAVVLLLTD